MNTPALAQPLPGGPRPARWRRLLRWGLYSLAALVGLPLLVMLAWVLSNLGDIAPVPQPAALALPAPELRDEGNGFFALVGLNAQAGRDPASAGRAVWLANRDWAAAMPSNRVGLPTELAQRDDADKQAMGERLQGFVAAPAVCNAEDIDCAEQWLRASSELAAQRDRNALQGARCEALLGNGFAFEEPRQAPHGLAQELAEHASGASFCSAWLRSGAVLAWQQSRRAQALVLLQQSARLDTALLEGGITHINQMVALRLTRNTQEGALALGLRDPDFARELLPLFSPVPDLIGPVRRWMVHESNFGRMALAGLDACLSSGNSALYPQPGWVSSVVEDAFSALACRQIGWHPQRTQAAADARWLDMLQGLDHGLSGALQHLDAMRQAQDQRSLWARLAWRNSIGVALLAANGQASWAGSLARRADVELHRQATLLALKAAAERVPAAERAAWSQRQDLSADLRERLLWDANGQAFSVRPWQGTLGTAPVDPRVALRIVWPAS